MEFLHSCSQSQVGSVIWVASTQNIILDPIQYKNHLEYMEFAFLHLGTRN